jgi:hypothetical protein
MNKTLKKALGYAVMYFGLSLFALMFLAQPWIAYKLIVETGVYHYSVFWIAAILEIGLAIIIYEIPNNHRGLSGLVWTIAFISPFLLSHYIISLRPIKVVWYVFIITLVLIYGIQYLRKYIKKKLKKGTKFSDESVRNHVKFSQSNHNNLNIILPRYLPDGYKEVEQNVSRKKGYTIIEQLYQRDESEHLIWLKQANGQIPDSKLSNKFNINEEKIKGINVAFAQEIKKRSTSAKSQELAYIEANWNVNGLNFNFRADELSLDETKKVIASMIK